MVRAGCLHQPPSLHGPQGIRGIDINSSSPIASQSGRSEQLDRLGCYVLPGAAHDLREGLEQARDAEALGLGTVWIGERYDSKDLPSLASALGQVTERVRIGAAIAHPILRHPMVLASMGQTLQSLTGGRFALGSGRSGTSPACACR